MPIGFPTSPDFISENREIYRVTRIMRALFRDIPLRFVGDSGLDDQKIFAPVAAARAQFIFRAPHEDRLVDVIGSPFYLLHRPHLATLGHRLGASPVEAPMPTALTSCSLASAPSW